MIIPLETGKEIKDQFGPGQIEQLKRAANFMLANKNLNAYLEGHTVATRSRKSDLEKTRRILDFAESQLILQGILSGRIYLEPMGAARPRFDPVDYNLNERIEFSFRPPSPQTPIP